MFRRRTLEKGWLCQFCRKRYAEHTVILDSGNHELCTKCRDKALKIPKKRWWRS